MFKLCTAKPCSWPCLIFSNSSMKSSFIWLNQLWREFSCRGSMTKGSKYSIFFAFGNFSSQSNDARVLASKGTFGTCPSRGLDSWMALLFYYWQFFLSWRLLTWALQGSAIHVRFIQPSSSRLFSLPLVSGDFRIQAGNSMNQSVLITNTGSPFRQSGKLRARESWLF